MMRLIGLMLMLLSVVGCGQSEAQVAAGGTVRHAGSPLSQIEVVFVPENGKDFFHATTDSNGRYHMAGIPAGRYVALLREPVKLDKFAGQKGVGLPGNPARHAQKVPAASNSRIPASYSARESTPLRDILVREGHDHDFNIPER